jgi:hypothetical protein
MPISRRRGVPGGLLIALLGLWAALIPFVGPYFDFEFGSDETWKWTTDRLWLDVLPGAVALLGGLILIRATTRAGGSAGAWLALLAGLWLIVGPTVSTLWNDGVAATGPAIGSDFRAALEWIGFFYGAGGLITLFSAYEMGFLAALPVVDRATAVSSPPEPPSQAPRRRWLGRWGSRRSPAQPTA